MKEIETLEKIGAWDVVDQPEGANAVDSTWAFEIKCYPDGLIKKFKARFCVRGDQQVHGVDFFETYAPVVQWTTIRLILILEVLLGLKSKQGDISAASVHADVEKDKHIYVLKCLLGLGSNEKFSSSRRLFMVCARAQQHSGSISQ